MINVSNDFKETAKELTKQIRAYVVDNAMYPDEITESDDLKSMKITINSDLLRTVMRTAEATYFNDHNWLDQYVNLGYGIVLPQVDNLGAFTVTIATPGVFTLNSHGLNTGDKVRLETTDTLPTGLAIDTFYFVIRIDNNTFNLATSYGNAISNVRINTSGSQSGTHTLFSYPAGQYTAPEYIDFGSFKVISQETTKGGEETKIKMYDKMIESLVRYDLEPIYDVVYPCTLLEFLEAICTKLGWTLATTSFPNDDLVISSDLFTNQGYQCMTYRAVLDQIAEATASIIYFNNDNELVLRQVSHDTELDTIDQHLLNSLKLETLYGEVNSVVLSRSPQEDNIVDQDETSIETYGLTELKIFNNQLVDSDRETYIQPIFDELFGLKYHPFKATTIGLGYFEVGDRVNLVDPNENNFEGVIFDITLEFSGGIKETLGAKIPVKTSTAYQYAGILGQTITNTQIIVDKQNAQIQLINTELTENYYTKDETTVQISIATDSIVSSVSEISITANQALDQAELNADNIVDLQSEITTLTQTSESLELAIEGVGGVNLIKNSVGLRGDVEEWQNFDANGDLIDGRNNATIINSSDVQENTESGSALNLVNQFIEETFPTIVGEKYTVYFRYKNTLALDVSITGVGTINPPVSADWSVFKYEFTATGASTTFRLENGGGGADATISDIVVKLGTASGWVQAPNEVYGTNFRFDKEGFSITSLTDPFKTLLDNRKLAAYDTSGGTDTIMMLVDIYAAMLTKLVAQEETVFQRYGNSDASMRLIPVEDGAYIVIND